MSEYAPVMTAWLAITVAAVARPTRGSRNDFRYQEVERIFDGGGIGEDEGALPEIVQEQRWQHQKEPRGLDWLSPEVPEIRVERFRTSGDEEHGAQRDETHPLVVDKKCDRVVGIDCRKHGRIIEDVHSADEGDDEEPYYRDWAEQLRDLRGAARLDREQRHENDDGDRQYVRIERWRRDLETLDSRKHRERRRDQTTTRRTSPRR